MHRAEHLAATTASVAKIEASLLRAGDMEVCVAQERCALSIMSSATSLGARAWMQAPRACSLSPCLRQQAHFCRQHVRWQVHWWVKPLARAETGPS